MKEGSKKISLGSLVNIVKASLIGVITSILLVLIFAFVLKFVNLNTSTISLVDQIIKVISVFVAMIMLNKGDGEKLLVKGLLVGMVYAIITFIVFSALNGGFSLTPAIFTDIAFSALIGGVCAIIINIFKRK